MSWPILLLLSIWGVLALFMLALGARWALLRFYPSIRLPWEIEDPFMDAEND